MAEGYVMPAEWEPHARVWLGWPTRADVWPDGGRGSGGGRAAFAQVAAAAARFEDEVCVCAPDEAAAEDARATLAAAGAPDNVRVRVVPQDDAWFRDTAPTFVVRRTEAAAGAKRKRSLAASRGAVCWRFNAWGEKCYSSHALDDAVGGLVAELGGVPSALVRRPQLVLEGGSVHVDGEGTALVTESCLLNPNRNIDLPTKGQPRTRVQLEHALREHLGVEKAIWLPSGLKSDWDTDGHVDNIAAFVAPGKVVLAWTDDEADTDYASVRSARGALEEATDARGRRLEVHLLHLPRRLTLSEDEAGAIENTSEAAARHAGDDLCASYVNFYLARGSNPDRGEGGVLVPQFGQPDSDKAALAKLGELFPGRQVVPISLGRAIAVGGGNVHCITCQQPAADEGEAGAGGAGDHNESAGESDSGGSGDEDDSCEDESESEGFELVLDADGRTAGVGGSMDYATAIRSGSQGEKAAAAKAAIAAQLASFALDLGGRGAAGGAVASAVDEEGGEYLSQGMTFWVGADDAPACDLERLALDIFELHTAAATFDRDRSGVEWWVQDLDAGDDIQFHFDRDYTLESEGGVCVCPHLGTVTYLTSHGGPTVVVDRASPEAAGGAIQGAVRRASLCYPQELRHLSFDGRLLHGATSDLLIGQEGAPQQGQRRVTFLANVWLNHVPHGTVPLPKERHAAGGSAGVRVGFAEAKDAQVEKLEVGGADYSPEAVLALDFGDGGTPYTLALDVPASQLRAALDAGAGGFDIEYGEGAQAGVYGRH